MCLQQPPCLVEVSIQLRAQANAFVFADVLSLGFLAGFQPPVHPEDGPHLGVIQGVKADVCRVCLHRHGLQQEQHFRLAYVKTRALA